MLKLGSQNISALYVGGTKIKRALVGETVVFEGVQTVGVPTQSGTLTYSGSFQSPAWSGYDSSAMTIGGTTSATEAGSYTAAFTLKSGYVWPDGTTGTKNVGWTIGKATASCRISPSSTLMEPISITVGETMTLSISCTGCTVIGASSGDPSILEVSSFDSTKLRVKALSTGSSGGGGIMAAAIVSPATGVSCFIALSLSADENYEVNPKSLHMAYFSIE